MTIIDRGQFLELTADEGKSIHRADSDVYGKAVCVPAGTDTTVYEEVADGDIPPEEEPYTEEDYAEAGRILLGQETGGEED